MGKKHLFLIWLVGDIETFYSTYKLKFIKLKGGKNKI